MATRCRNRSAGGPGVLLVAATGLAAAAVALDAGFDLPAGLRAVLFAAWAAAVGVLGWGAVGRSARRPGEAWVAGGATVAAFGLLVVCVPGGVRAGRLVPPWTASPSAVRLTVATGDPVVARGAGVTLACVCERLSADALASVRMEVRGAEGESRTVEPTEELTGVLSARLPAVVGPLAYRFVGGGAATAWHRITPADPVALTTDSSLTAHPPAYAASHFPTRRFAVSEDITCLAGGRVSARLLFDRPATDVRVVWTADGDDHGRPVTVEPASDGRSATVATDVTASGRLTLTLTGDHGYRSVVALPLVAALDQVPHFVSVDGFDAGRWPVRPNELLTATVEVRDDAWAAPPILELLLGPSPESVVARPIALSGLGGGHFRGRLSVSLAEQWHGESLVARLRLSDPLRQAGAVFPADGWIEFSRSESAAPLGEQIVLAQRDQVTNLLAGALTSLSREPQDSSGVARRQIVMAAEAACHVEPLDPLTAELRRLEPLTGREETDSSASLAAAQDLNRRLAVARLDRLRLFELANSLRELAERGPTGQEVASRRDRLAALTANSPRLSAARTAAVERELAEAVASAGRLSDELELAADHLEADRVTRLRPLAARAEELTAQLEEVTGRWSTAATVVGADSSAAVRLRRACQLLRDARATDALPVLDAASRHFTDLASAFAHAAEGRCDPREAARQLVHWRSKLDARPGPPPADELNRWHAFASHLATLAHLHDPTGGDDPERIAREFPTPIELKRRAVQTLREVAAAAPTARKPAELSALASRLSSLPPPAQSRPSRLAWAVAEQAANDLAVGRTHDAAAGATELRWRADALASALAGDGDPLSVLDEKASARTVDRLGALAVRVGLPTDFGGEPDTLRVAVRARVDGSDTDRQRVALAHRSWASRKVVSPEHVRDLLSLLETIRVGDDPKPITSVVSMLHDIARPPDFKDAVASALVRLKDGLGRSADQPLSRRAELDKPTAAERLIDFDTGHLLPSRPLAEDARRFAAEVQRLGQEVANIAATLQGAESDVAVRTMLQAELTRLGPTFLRHGSPEPVAERWREVIRTWDRPGELSDRLCQTANALRQVVCMSRPASATSPDLGIGQLLLAAEHLFTESEQAVNYRVAEKVRAAASVLEKAAK